ELWDQVPYLYVYMGEYRKSLDASGRYLAKHPGDVWQLFRRVEGAVGAGDRAAAADALRRIEALTSAKKGENEELDRIEGLLGGRLEMLRVTWILTSCPATIAAGLTEPWILETRKAERRLSLLALAQALRLRPDDAALRASAARIFADIARLETGRMGATKTGALIEKARDAVRRGE